MPVSSFIPPAIQQKLLELQSRISPAQWSMLSAQIMPRLQQVANATRIRATQLGRVPELDPAARAAMMREVFAPETFEQPRVGWRTITGAPTGYQAPPTLPEQLWQTAETRAKEPLPPTLLPTRAEFQHLAQTLAPSLELFHLPVKAAIQYGPQYLEKPLPTREGFRSYLEKVPSREVEQLTQVGMPEIFTERLLPLTKPGTLGRRVAEEVGGIGGFASEFMLYPEQMLAMAGTEVAINAALKYGLPKVLGMLPPSWKKVLVREIRLRKPISVNETQLATFRNQHADWLLANYSPQELAQMHAQGVMGNKTLRVLLKKSPEVFAAARELRGVPSAGKGEIPVPTPQQTQAPSGMPRQLPILAEPQLRPAMPPQVIYGGPPATLPQVRPPAPSVVPAPEAPSAPAVPEAVRRQVLGPPSAAKEAVEAMLAREAAAEIAAPKMPVAAKEPWQMTNIEYAKSLLPSSIAVQVTKFQPSFAAQHKVEIKTAISEGKPVPPEVLAEYPDLAAKVPAVPSATKPTIPIIAGRKQNLQADLAGWQQIRTNAQVNGHTDIMEDAQQQIGLIQRQLLSMQDVTPVPAKPTLPKAKLPKVAKPPKVAKLPTEREPTAAGIAAEAKLAKADLAALERVSKTPSAEPRITKVPLEEIDAASAAAQVGAEVPRPPEMAPGQEVRPTAIRPAEVIAPSEARDLLAQRMGRPTSEITQEQITKLQRIQQDAREVGFPTMPDNIPGTRDYHRWINVIVERAAKDESLKAKLIRFWRKRGLLGQAGFAYVPGKRDIAGAATRAQKAFAHMFARELGLGPRQFARLKKVMTGKKSMVGMTDVEAATFINAMKGILGAPPHLTMKKAIVPAEFYPAQKFKKPTILRYVTPADKYIADLGAYELTQPVIEGKARLMDAQAQTRALFRKLEADYMKAAGTKLPERARAFLRNQPTVAKVRLYNALDTYEHAPQSMSPAEAQVFNVLRSFSQNALARANEVRERFGLPPIKTIREYVAHIYEVFKQGELRYKYPFPQELEYLLSKLKAKNVFNWTALERTAKDPSGLLKDPFKAMQAMVMVDLKQIYLQGPLYAFREQMKALRKGIPWEQLPEAIRAKLPEGVSLPVIPGRTAQYLEDFVNTAILGYPTELDKAVTATVEHFGINKALDLLLRPFGRAAGLNPVQTMMNAITRVVYDATLWGRVKVVLRNYLQSGFALGLYNDVAFAKALKPATPELRKLIHDSPFYRTNREQFLENTPKDVLSKLEQIGFRPFEQSQADNVAFTQRVAAHAADRLIQDPQYAKLGWTQADKLKEMEWGGSVAQFWYNLMGLPEIFRHHSLRPFTQFSSYFFNVFFKYVPELLTRGFKGQTGWGKPIPTSWRLNALRQLVLMVTFGEGVRRAFHMSPEQFGLMGALPYTMAFAPAAQALWGATDWMLGRLHQNIQQEEDGLKRLKYSLKTLVPGYGATREFKQVVRGEKPVSSMFLYTEEPHSKETYTFYRRFNQLRKLEKQYNELQGEKRTAFRQVHPELQFIGDFRGTARDMAEIRKEIVRIRKQAGLSRQERLSKIKVLQDKHLAAVTSVLKKVS